MGRAAFPWSLLSFAVIALLCSSVWGALDKGKVPAINPAVRIGSYPATILPGALQFVPQTPGDSQEQQGLVWLDDNRVMFVGVVGGDPASLGLYIWEVNTREVTKYSNHTRFCFADGYIAAHSFRADQPQSKLRSIKFGRLGEEVDGTCDTSKQDDCSALLNMSCKRRAFLGAAPTGNEAVYAIELRNGDGVIVNPVAMGRVKDLPKGVEAQRAYFARPYLLVSKRFPEGKALPISAVEEIRPWRASYSSYAKRYVLVTERPADGQVGLSGTWPRGRAQPIFLMDVEGNVDTVPIPSRQEWNSIRLAQVMIPGTVFWGTGSRENEWGGIFLYTKFDLVALDRGKVEAIAVSPNGCKVAYAMFVDYGRVSKLAARVKHIDVCVRGG